MNLPPQAYTKETLIQAYNWLRSQPPHIQELAKTPEALVSLYSKAQMHGENYLSRSNNQSFKSELKTLANQMGDFENESLEGPVGTIKNPATLQSQSQSQSHSQSQTQLQNQAQIQMQQTKNQINSNQISLNSASTSTSSQIQNTGHTATAAHSNSNAYTTNAYMNSPMIPMNLTQENNSAVLNAFNQQLQSQGDLKSALDSRSWTMIQEVKNHFNLSSETEAVRLLIAMGYQKMRSQF